METEQKTLYFQHIPKTAGTSVKSWLAHHLGDSLCSADIADQLVAVPRQELERYSAFAGHFHCYLSSYLEREIVTATVLRDPLSRTRSHWHQVRRHDLHPHHARVSRQTFDEFIKDNRNCVMIENYQARYLVRMPFDMRAMASRFSDEELSRYALAESLEQVSLNVSKAVLAAHASETLQNMAVVGTCERLGDFLADLGRILDIPPPIVEPRKNVTDRDMAGELSAFSLEKLRDMTRIDQELYDGVSKQPVFAGRFAKSTHSTST